MIIDCGANAGFGSKFFAITYPEARILAIEPSVENVELAKQNTHGHDVELFQAGIASKDCMGTLQDPGLGNDAYRVTFDGQLDLQLLSIGTLLNRYSEDRFVPFLVKIDIEGFEADLFKENTEWVQKFPVLIVELHDWMLPRSANSQNFLKCVSSLDRDFVFRGENVFSIKNTND